jgi:O-antigen/teichoic acid export membrane protein
MVKELVKDISKFLFFRVLLTLGWLISIAFTTRLLSTEEYGNYIIVFTSITIAVAISVGWISTSIIRFYSEYDLDGKLAILGKKVFRTAITSILIVSCILLSFTVIPSKLVDPKLEKLAQIGILAFIALSTWNVFISYLRAKRLVVLYSFFNLWQNLGTMILGLLLVYYLNYKVDGMIWGIIIGIFLFIPIIYYYSVVYNKNENISTLKISKSNVELGERKSGFVAYGLPIVLVNVCTISLSNLDKFFISFYQGSSFTGIYSACYAISEQSIFVITSLFSLTSIPILFRMWSEGKKNEVKLFQTQILRYYLAIAVPATIGLSVLAKPVIELLVDSKYSTGYVILPIVSLGAFFVGIANIYSEVLTLKKKTINLMLCYVLAFIVNIVSNFILVPVLGYMGAAYSTVITYIVLMIVVIYQANKFLKIKFPTIDSLKILFASAVMGLGVYGLTKFFTHYSLFYIAGYSLFGLLVYSLITICFLKILTVEEKIWIKSKFRYFG